MGVQSYDIVDSGELTIDGAGAASLVDHYIVLMDSARDTRQQLIAGLKALQRGAPHPLETGLFANGLEARQDAHSALWRVKVNYSDTFDVDNPLAQPAAISMKSQRLTSATLLDNKGRMMLNTAGTPFEPQEKGETLYVISVKKNVADYPAWLLDYPDAINNDAVRIRKLQCQPGTLALTGLSIPDYVLHEKTKIQYLPLEFEVTYRKSGWHTVVPSRGYLERVEVTNWEAADVGSTVDVVWKTAYTLRPIHDNRGQPINNPMLLDKDGRALRFPKPQDVVTLKFTIPVEKPFNALPFK